MIKRMIYKWQQSREIVLRVFFGKKNKSAVMYCFLVHL